MPRTRRIPKIGPLLDDIEHQVSRLDILITQGEAKLVPFCPHYEALGALRRDLQRAVNLLNDRPADWVKPYGVTTPRT
jgi:hypothetical protein